MWDCYAIFQDLNIFRSKPSLAPLTHPQGHTLTQPKLSWGQVRVPVIKASLHGWVSGRMPTAGTPNGSQTHVIPQISDALFGTRSHTPGAR